MGGQKPETNKNKISVGLLAHVDAGKTTLSEALLYLTGAIRKMGRVLLMLCMCRIEILCLKRKMEFIFAKIIRLLAVAQPSQL